MRRDRLHVQAVLVALALTMGTSEARAQEVPRPPLVVLVDPDLSMDPGVRSTTSLARVVFRYDEVVRGGVDGDSTEARVLGATGRSLKVALIDAPLAMTAVTFAHEVFGHGSRAREQGLPVSYAFGVPEPYRTLLGQDDALAGEARFGQQAQVDQNFALVSSGIEADYRTAYWINRDLVENGGWTHYGDMLMYAAARLSYASSLLSPADHREPSNDVSNYVGLLQRRFNRWTAEDRGSIESGLRTAYAWNLLDPTLLFAGYAVIEHIAQGTRRVRAPLPSVRDVAFLPWPSFALSPFGAEHGMTLFLSRDDLVIDVEGRVGTSGLASYGGGGIHASGLELADFIRARVGIDAWTQPELLLDDRNVFDRPNRVGANVATEGTFALSRSAGLVMAVAYKSKGFLPGRPLDRGLYGYAGWSWSGW